MTFTKMNKEIELKSIATMLEIRRYQVVAEKVYLTSDQYVVKLLGDKEQEIAKLNKKYDDLLKKFVALQDENKKYEELKKRFSVEETTEGQGYKIIIKDEDGNYQSTFAYCWDKEEPSPDFLKLLDLIGLTLPKENK